MTPFPQPLTGTAAPLIVDNVDTDTIIPSREMRSTGRTGLAEGMFAPWRYSDADSRTENPGFVLNRPEHRDARILLGGANFGCGSSREHAVWALAEWGIRCVIAESFAPIFRGNCIRNGILPVTLERNFVERLAEEVVTVDLEEQEVRQDEQTYSFAIDPEAKQMLAEGLDAIDLTLIQNDAIEEWTRADRKARPWVYLHPPHGSGEGDHAKHGGGVHYKLPPKTNTAIMRAKTMRRAMPPSETRLWQELRKRPGGFKFRRQHPAGDYVMDFFSPAAGLCIEVDGEAHDRGKRPDHDSKRDAFLRECGVEVFHIPARHVFQDIESVVRMIVEAAQRRLPLHQPAAGPPPRQAGEEGGAAK